MKLLTRLFAMLGVAAIGIAPSALFAAKDKGVDVLISSDAIPSPEGFRPKPDKPIHYLLMQGRQTLGEIVAGVKLPDSAVVENAVVAELKKQGFVRTEVGGPLPEIVIVATIGDANFEPPPLPPPGNNPLVEPDFAPYLYQVNVRQILTQNLLSGKISAENIEGLFGLNPTISTNDPDLNEARELVLNEAIRVRERTTDRGRDRPKILALVGANKVEKAVVDRALGSVDAERIVYATRNNLLYVTLTAFDATAWKEKQKVVLWRTTMLIDWRVDFSKALTEILAQAGPVFGTDVAVPGFINTARTREGKIEVGPAKVVPEHDQPGISPNAKK
jgi:hypothetical protein